MNLDWRGQTLQFDPEAITLKQAKEIKKQTGKSLAAWQNALTAGGHDLDEDVAISLLWLVFQQNGQDVPFEDVDCTFGELALMFKGMADEAPPADPTPAPTVPDPAPATE